MYVIYSYDTNKFETAGNKNISILGGCENLETAKLFIRKAELNLNKTIKYEISKIDIIEDKDIPSSSGLRKVICTFDRDYYAKYYYPAASIDSILDGDLIVNQFINKYTASPFAMEFWSLGASNFIAFLVNVEENDDKNSLLYKIQQKIETIIDYNFNNNEEFKKFVLKECEE